MISVTGEAAPANVGAGPPAEPAWHVRGVLLPDDDVVDLWWVGDRLTRQPVTGARTLSDRGFILPGLVDAHCHLGIRNGGAPIESLDEARELATMDRDTGVLALRDAGSPFPYPQLDHEPGIPRLARAGRHVAPIQRYLRGVGIEVDAAGLAQAVRDQAAAGTGWVKLVGDWINRERGDLAPAWEPEAMAVAVKAAHDAGARVAAHLFAEESVAALVRAGVDSVEHGTGLDEDDIAEMAHRGTALVPTMYNVDNFDGIADRAESKFPAYAQHMRRLRQRFPAVVAMAHEAGVPIYAGTDAGGGVRHGMIAAEMRLLAERTGMTTVEVLAAASWRARAWLGFPGLVEGGLADLVVYAEDPRRDLRVIGTPSLIVLRGRPLTRPE